MIMNAALAVNFFALLSPQAQRQRSTSNHGPLLEPYLETLACSRIEPSETLKQACVLLP